VERLPAQRIRFRHARSGETFDVPMHDLPPAQLVELQGQLQALVA
jgi:hypothetical protein